MKSLVNVGSRSLRRLFSNCFSSKLKPVKMNFYMRDSTESESSEEYNYRVKSIQVFIPRLTFDLHKGQCGRVGVIGGSFEYTGAPYFAAISSLKMGADVVHVFCSREAGPAIKSYTPELIVHPFLDSADVVKKMEPWLEILHALVIGPGMGRDKGILKNVGDIITFCKKKQNQCLPLIIDADGLYLITENLNLLKDYKGPVILTPNKVEFNRLSDKMSERNLLKISSTLNAILLCKGYEDIITNGIYNSIFNLSADEVTIECDIPGSNRRCGGQGDVLSGCIATFVAWLELYFRQNGTFSFSELKNEDKKWFFNTFMNYSFAVYGACVVTRTCSRLAYETHGRGMTASDMIFYINKAFKLHFGP